MIDKLLKHVDKEIDFLKDTNRELYDTLTAIEPMEFGDKISIKQKVYNILAVINNKIGLLQRSRVKIKDEVKVKVETKSD